MCRLGRKERPKKNEKIKQSVEESIQIRLLFPLVCVCVSLSTDQSRCKKAGKEKGRRWSGMKTSKETVDIYRQTPELFLQ